MHCTESRSSRYEFVLPLNPLKLLTLLIYYLQIQRSSPAVCNIEVNNKLCHIFSALKFYKFVVYANEIFFKTFLWFGHWIFSDSTNPEYFAVPMGILVESIYGNNTKTLLLPAGVTAHAPTQPLPMSMLDSLTVHAKMRWVTKLMYRKITGFLRHCWVCFIIGG